MKIRADFVTNSSSSSFVSLSINSPKLVETIEKIRESISSYEKYFKISGNNFDYYINFDEIGGPNLFSDGFPKNVEEVIRFVFGELLGGVRIEDETVKEIVADTKEISMDGSGFDEADSVEGTLSYKNGKLKVKVSHDN